MGSEAHTIMKPFAGVTSLIGLAISVVAGQMGGEPLAEFRDLFDGKHLNGWINVNTSADTFRVKSGVLVCSGHPIGVMRTAKQYENFVLHIEWMHIEPGGNSGVFVLECGPPRCDHPVARWY